MDTVSRNQKLRDKIAKRADIHERGEEEFEEAEQHFEDLFQQAEETASVEKERLEEERERAREHNARQRSLLPSHMARREKAMSAIREEYEARQQEPEPPDWEEIPDREIAAERWGIAHNVTPEEWAQLNDPRFLATTEDVIEARREHGRTGDPRHVLRAVLPHLERIRANSDRDYVEELKRSRADTKRKF